MAHNERCKECKVRVRQLLEKIYGPVVPNHRIPLGTRPEDLWGHPRSSALNEIFAALQAHRGFDKFVRAGYVDVDFFLPERQQIIEFDESQHFTEPRRLALSGYPADLTLGFSREAWVSRCDEIGAHDNNPPYRDEQRAWYDTLRDFLPESQGLRPTVRIFARDMAWCTLDPDDADDVRQFRDLIESSGTAAPTLPDERYRNMPKEDWIGTVILQSDLEQAEEKDPRNNPRRVTELAQILGVLVERTMGDGVLLFPGGWVHTQYEPALTIYPEIERCVTEALGGTDRNIKVCIGIDGYFNPANGEDPYDQDQIALTVDRTGIIAVARKFHPTDDVERSNIILAQNHIDGELGKPRTFDLNGIRFFPFVCYDVYGPFNDPQRFPPPEADIGLNLIHRFRPKGEKLFQENYFPTKGWSEASCVWGIPIFGTSIFFRRQIPQGWPTGIVWTGGKDWHTPKYHEIALPHDAPVIVIPLPEGAAEVRIFTNIAEKIKAKIEDTARGDTSMGYVPITFRSRPAAVAVTGRAEPGDNVHFRSLFEVFENDRKMSGGPDRVAKRKNKATYTFGSWKTALAGSPVRVCYELNYHSNDVGMPAGETLQDQISVEFQAKTVETGALFADVKARASAIMRLMPGKPVFVTPPKQNWHLLKYLYPADTDPEDLSLALRILVHQTKGDVDRWLESRASQPSG